MMMHTMLSISDEAYYACCRSMIHMLSIYDDASHRSTVHATHAIDR